jgi:hypothetical protein
MDAMRLPSTKQAKGYTMAQICTTDLHQDCTNTAEISQFSPPLLGTKAAILAKGSLIRDGTE